MDNKKERVKEIICDRCGKVTDNWSGTPNFRVCEDCFKTLAEDGSIGE